MFYKILVMDMEISFAINKASIEIKQISDKSSEDNEDDFVNSGF